MRRILLIILMLACFSACEKAIFPEDGNGTAPSDRESLAPLASSQLEVHRLDVGDVEATVRISGMVEPGFEHPAVSEEKLNNRKDQLVLNTVTVGTPRPETLPIRFSVDSQSGFENTPVAMTIGIYLEDEKIDEFSAVLGKTAYQDINDRVVDVMKKVGPDTETVLLTAKAKVLLMPEGTQEEDVDPATATTTKERISIIHSNPVRIDFVKEDS